MTTAELDAAVLGFVAERPGSSVWDICMMFPQVTAAAPEPPAGGDGGMFRPPPGPPRTVPSVKPVQIVESLRRLRQDGRVRMTKDPGERGTERWSATDY